MSVAELKPDLTEFEALGRSHPATCVVARSRDRLNAKDRASFDVAIARKDAAGEYVYADYAISRFLAKRGLGGREQAVKKHRNGECCCV